MKQEIIDYIRKNPNVSRIKLAKKFGINPKEARTILHHAKDGISEIKIGEKFTDRFRSNKIYSKLSAFLNSFPHSGKIFYINLFLLAFSIRILYAAIIKNQPMLTLPILDAEYYMEWAKRILSEGIIGKKVFFTEPFYAYLWAFFMKIIPGYDRFALITIQVLMGSLLPLLVTRISLKAFPKGVSYLAGIITAIYGPFVFYDFLLLKTSMETFLLASLILVLLNISEKGSRLRYLLAGMFLGFISSVKGNVSLLLPVFIFFTWIFIKINIRQKIIYSVLFTAGFFLLIMPMTVRNYIAGKDFVLTNYSIGIVLHGGNWWGGDGGILAPPFVRPHPKYEETDMYKMAESYMGRTLKPSEVSSFWTSQAIRDIREDPARWIRLVGKKMLLFVTNRELSDNYDYAFYVGTVPLLRLLPSFFPLAAITLTGTFMIVYKRKNLFSDDRKRHAVYFILLVLGAYSSLVVTAFVNSRYRVAVIPYVIIIASFSIYYLFRIIKEKNLKNIALFILLAGIFSYATTVHLDNFDYMTDANFYNHMATYEMDNKNYSEAEKYFLKALETKKDFAWAYTNLFKLYMNMGEPVLAFENLGKALALRPDDTGGYYHLKLFQDLKDKPKEFIQNRMRLEAEKSLAGTGESKGSYDQYFYEFMKYYTKGNLALARENLLKSAQKYDRPENTLLNLAVVEKQLGKPEISRTLYDEILRKNHNYLAAKYNLSHIYFTEKNYEKSAELLSGVVEVSPEYGNGDALYFLGASYINDRKYTLADPIVKDYIRKYQSDPAKKEKVDKFKALLVSKENIR